MDSGSAPNFFKKNKTAVLVLLTTITAQTIAFVVFTTIELARARWDVRQDATILADVVGHNSAAALLLDDRKKAGDSLRALKANKHVASSCVYTVKDQIFASYKRDDVLVECLSVPMAEGYAYQNGFLLLTKTLWIEQDRWGVIFIKYDLRELDNLLTRHAGIFFVVIFFSSVIAFFAASKVPVKDQAAYRRV